MNRSMHTPFQNVSSINPGRSVFDLSYEYKTMCDMGQLIPVYVQEAVPGDRFDIGNDVIIRFNPLVAPIMHEINAYIHYFFAPYRLLWPEPNGWESFITGGIDGQFAGVLPTIDAGSVPFPMGSLGDYLGYPLTYNLAGVLPMAFPTYAYNLIFNQYYRDETLSAEVTLLDGNIKRRAWEKDYFTSALPWQQRGTAPSLPISGTSHAIWGSGVFPAANLGVNFPNLNNAADARIGNSAGNAQLASNLNNAFNNNTVDLSSATTFNVADLRLAFQIQKWLERNARAGARYIEFLNSHFGVHPRDERLQRAEYIGGSKSPVIISEVLQTSATGLSGGTTAQGTMAGHGLTVDRNYCCKYHVPEFGLIMGILSVMPRTVYSQGINRMWLRKTKYDFYFPEFANLSEQAIIRAEIYADSDSGHNTTVFGYQGRYDEMRYRPSVFTANFRTTPYYTWHLGRIFGSAPLLNQSFIECNPDKRIFAAPSEPGLIVNIGNRVRAIRPLPVTAEPGLIDHN